MKKKTYSYDRSGLLALSTVSVMAPMLRLFPSGSAQIAGKAAWLSPFFAFPLLLIYVCFISSFMERREDGEGLCQLCMRAMGLRIGRLFMCVILLWLLLYSAFVLRSGADRIITTIYPNSSPPVFCICMAILGYVAAAGAVRTLVRSAKIVLPAVLGVLLLVLGFGLFSIDSSNLLPITSQDIVPALGGSLAAIDVLAVGLYCVCFVEGCCTRSQGRRLGFSVVLLLLTLLLTLLSVDVLGCFGVELCSILTRPFFSLVRNIVFFNSLERMEALVVSLWIFPDFLLLSVFLCGAQQCLRLILGNYQPYAGEKLWDLRKGRWCIAVCTFSALICSIVMAPDSKTLNMWSSQIIPLINLAFAFIFLPIIYILGRVRKRI